MKNRYSIWQEGKYWDAWIIPHFLSGSVLGFGFLLFNVPSGYGYLSAILLLVAWEIFEIVTKIREHKENQVGDMAVGIFGFVLAFSVFPLYFSNYLIAFIINAVLLGLFSLVGWFKYLKYGR